MKKLLVIIFTIYSWSNLLAQVEIYPAPPTSVFPTSEIYLVEVKQGNGSFQQLNVFKYTVPDNSFITKTESFAMLAFDPAEGAVTIRVSLKSGVNLNQNSIEVVNKTISGLKTEFEGGKMLITCSQTKKQVLVRQKSNFGDQLLICLDPKEEAEIPAGAQVLNFDAAGSPHVQSAQYDRLTVPNNVDIIYIEAGAVFMGTFHTENGRNKPLKLMGKGIILGNGDVIHGGAGIPWNAIEFNHGIGHSIEGITCISPRHFTIRASSDAVIDNVKMFGFDTNIDGIVAGSGSVISNCYFKVNDDHVKLYNNNMIVRDCNFYMQKNGGIFQLAWNSITPGSNCLVEDCEILAWEAGTGDPASGQGGIARTVLSLRETDAGSISSNIKIRNLYIQPKISRFIGINGKYGSSRSVSLKDVVFENVTLEQVPDSYSWIYTGDSPWEVDIKFNNVSISGECLTADNYEIRTEGNVKLTYNGCEATDTESPSTPNAPTVKPKGKNGLGVEWPPSSDNVEVTGYEVYLDGDYFVSVIDTMVDIANLECAKTYSIAIRSIDAAFNKSELSNTTIGETNNCDFLSRKEELSCSIFPNPVLGFLNLSTITDWKLLSINGKILQEGESRIIDMSLYPRGIYLLKTNQQIVKVFKS